MQEPEAPIRETFRTTGRAFELVWRGQRGLVCAYALATLVDALAPATIAYTGKVIIDRVLARQERGAIAMVLLELGLVVAQSLAHRAREYLDVVLKGRLYVRVHGMVLEKALGLRLRHFEDPAFLDRLERARGAAGMRPLQSLVDGFTLVKNLIRLTSYGALLWRFSPIAVIAIACSVMPQFVAQVAYARATFRAYKARTFEARQVFYLQRILADDQHVKEIKLFGLGQLLLGRFRRTSEGFQREDNTIARRHIGIGSAAGLLTSVTLYVCYGTLIRSAVHGQLTLGEMTLYLVLFRSGQAAFEELLNALVKVFESNLYLMTLFEFLALPTDEPDRPMPAAPWKPRAAPPGIELRGVSFHYPGSRRFVLDRLDLSVRPGETLALVGANGAGKTTIIKLLLRLQEPTAGGIFIDGQDVHDIEPSQLRSRIGVIFQDFTQFHLPLGDNIGVGWLPHLGDADAIAEAARKAGADQIAAALPDGYQTMLGRYYGGENLSLGQWQKVALARAFMRQGDILILDEPTASIDAEAEQEIFERFGKLNTGRTSLLITHRFSTVRMADRIAVLHHGRVVELGSHDELMALGRRYAHLFRLQARGYQLQSEAAPPPLDWGLILPQE